jgi:hypothetical protein
MCTFVCVSVASNQVRVHDPCGVIDAMAGKIVPPLPSPTHKDVIIITWVAYNFATDDPPDETWDGEVVCARWSHYTPSSTMDCIRALAYATHE